MRALISMPDRRLAILYAILIGASLPVWPYGWHLSLHVVGAVALIGNAIVMAVWVSFAGFSPHDSWKRRAADAVILGDLLFTIPGVLLVLANGLVMVFARYGGAGAFTTVPFIGVGLLLLTATGIVWATRLVPAQLRMRALARADGPIDAPRFRSALVGWSICGVVATVLPIAAAIAMNTKPTF